MSVVARFVVWTVALEGLWAVFVGTTQSSELIAGLLAAAVVALFVESLRARGLLGFRWSGRAVAAAWAVPAHVIFDWLLVLWILVREVVRRRRVRGTWVAIEYEEEPGARGRFRRALIATLENETANGMVVDLDEGRALLHSLDPRVSTGRSVL